MNNDQLEDLKQFIDSRISQSEARFGQKLEEKLEGLRHELEEKIDTLQQEMLDGFSGVGEAIDALNKDVDERLIKLEQQAA